MQVKSRALRLRPSFLDHPLPYRHAQRPRRTSRRNCIASGNSRDGRVRREPGETWSPQSPWTALRQARGSGRILDKTIHHPLLPGLVEIHRQLVAVHRRHRARPEFLVEDAVAAGEAGFAADDALGDELAFDRERLALGAAGRVGGLAVGLGALPAGGAVGGVEWLHLVEAGGAVTSHPAGAVAAIARRLGDSTSASGRSSRKREGIVSSTRSVTYGYTTTTKAVQSQMNTYQTTATTDPIGQFLQTIFGFLDRLFNRTTPTPAPGQPAAPTQVQPLPPVGGTQTVAGPTGGLSGTKTGTSIYKVVGNIMGAGSGVTIRGGGKSFRDNLGYPCNKCARESTWIFKPGTAGDWSPKLGSHGDEGGKETLIELANIQMMGTGGKWQCEGPHMTYKAVSGGTGSAPKSVENHEWASKLSHGHLGQNRIHHELWVDETGAGNNWRKFAEFNGAATGCNAITCPVPGSKCQDTMRLDDASGHQFISRSIVEIVPGAGAVGGGGGAASSNCCSINKRKEETNTNTAKRSNITN